MRVIGLMSGTSIDAVDGAVVDIATRDQTLEVSLLGWSSEPWSDELRDRIRTWSEPAASAPPGEIAAVSVTIGELFAVAARSAAGAAGLDLAAIDLVASHGQTVHHLVADEGRAVATLQLGQPAVIAERTGRTVVADFRPRDLAAGGQGAPLVSFVDALLLGEEARTVAALNLGGIANVTVVPAGRPFDSLAFDTGPGNSLLDAAARRLLGGQPNDRDGAAAAAGEPSEALLQELLAHSYFGRRPPKSTGRELFGEAFAARAIERGSELGLRDNDVLATLTVLTARSVATALAAFAPAWPQVLHVSGGGTNNPTLMRRLEQALVRHAPAGADPARLQPLDALGVPSAAKEALAFAVLGHEALHGRPNSLPGATGAGHSSVLGAIWPGSNYRHLVELVGGAQATTARVERIVVMRPASKGKGVAR